MLPCRQGRPRWWEHRESQPEEVSRAADDNANSHNGLWVETAGLVGLGSTDSIGSTCVVIALSDGEDESPGRRDGVAVA